MHDKYKLMNNDIKRVFIQTVTDEDAAFKLEAQWMNGYAKEGKNYWIKYAVLDLRKVELI